MNTPNLDAIGHQWVVALAGFNMTIEYLKGTDNKVAAVLSCIPQSLDPQAVTVFLNHAWASNISRAQANDPWVMEEHSKINEDIILCTHQMIKCDRRFWNLLNLNWVLAQMQDLVLCHVIAWIK